MRCLSIHLHTLQPTQQHCSQDTHTPHREASHPLAPGRCECQFDPSPSHTSTPVRDAALPPLGASTPAPSIYRALRRSQRQRATPLASPRVAAKAANPGGQRRLLLRRLRLPASGLCSGGHSSQRRLGRARRAGSEVAQTIVSEQFRSAAPTCHAPNTPLRPSQAKSHRPFSLFRERSRNLGARL